MNKQEIIKLAIRSGLKYGYPVDCLEIFARLVAEKAAAEERKACAKACADIARDDLSNSQFLMGATACFDRILARNLSLRKKNDRLPPLHPHLPRRDESI